MLLYDAVDAVLLSVWVSYPHWAVGFWPPCPKCHALNAMLKVRPQKQQSRSHMVSLWGPMSRYIKRIENHKNKIVVAPVCSEFSTQSHMNKWQNNTTQYDTYIYILQPNLQYFAHLRTVHMQQSRLQGPESCWAVHRLHEPLCFTLQR